MRKNTPILIGLIRGPAGEPDFLHIMMNSIANVYNIHKNNIGQLHVIHVHVHYTTSCY